MTVLQTYLGVASESSEGKVLRLLIELGAQFVNATEGSLLAMDEATGELVFAMTVGPAASEKMLAGKRVPLGEGLVGLAAQTHEVQIGAPKYDVPGGVSQQGTPKAVLAAPMLIDDRLVGVITAVSFDDNLRFTSRDAMLYGRIAAVAGVVVDQCRRLAAIEALQRSERLPDAVTDEERLDRNIVASVDRLTQLRHGDKVRVVQLLAAVEALVAAS